MEKKPKFRDVNYLHTRLGWLIALLFVSFWFLPAPLAHAETARRGIGLQIMNYRAHVIDGSLDISPAGSGGTVVTCSFSNQENKE